MKDQIMKFLELHIREITGWDAINPINDNTNLNQIGVDSLDKVQLIMEVEREYALAIADSDIDSFKTVGDLIEYIEKNVKNGDTTGETTTA